MCLILLAWRAHPQYPLIFAGNRDEAYDRPSAAAGFWQDAPDIFGGRDLEKGGTWLGLNRSGHFAAVTNYRDGPAARKPAPRSRGELAAGFLRGSEKPDSYLKEVLPEAGQYGGFSLLTGNADRLCYLSNRGGGIEDLPAGVHGLSNHLLDTPWPKVRLGRQRVAALLAADETKLLDGLFLALADRSPAPDSELPDSGVGLQRERELSPAFIAGERYGTRASTVLLVSQGNEAIFVERAFGPMGLPAGPEVSRRFTIQVRASGRKTKAAGQDV
jgi:uncharacterized protein with NRDE domain